MPVFYTSNLVCHQTIHVKLLSSHQSIHVTALELFDKEIFSLLFVLGIVVLIHRRSSKVTRP